jgi:hypothetical protein
MGIGYVISVFDDAIRGAKIPGAERDKITDDLAEGVLKLCLDPDYESHQDGLRRITDAIVGNRGNGLNFVDAIHSREWGVYLWGENCLRKINDLDDFGFEKLQELVANEELRRNS